MLHWMENLKSHIFYHFLKSKNVSEVTVKASQTEQQGQEYRTSTLFVLDELSLKMKNFPNDPEKCDTYFYFLQIPLNNNGFYFTNLHKVKNSQK